MPIIITRTVKIVIFSFLLLSTTLLLIQKSYAKDISKSIENGQKKAAVCAACHGVNGNSVNPEWPSLANQSVKYMVEQLQHFKSGVRKNVLMSSQATNLSTEDMIDLSNYYNHQKPNIKAAAANEDVLILGETIYRGGIINREVPACIACHGPQGSGNNKAGYPKISGQHSLYLSNRLKAYRDNYDNRDEYGHNYSIMSQISFKLTPKEIEALASYMQALY
tara:strand:- start:379 stop:1041 length:663 start_codon:yes stop_codon:yes gene_type:complete